MPEPPAEQEAMTVYEETAEPEMALPEPEEPDEEPETEVNTTLDGTWDLLDAQMQVSVTG